MEVYKRVGGGKKDVSKGAQCVKFQKEEHSTRQKRKKRKRNQFFSSFNVLKAAPH